MEFAEIRQPHPDWPWTLSEGGNLFRTFTWKNIEYDLAELYPDNDSFLILEQKDPADETRYWFIQSAIALKGPQKDFILWAWAGTGRAARCCWSGATTGRIWTLSLTFLNKPFTETPWIFPVTRASFNGGML